MPQYRKKRMRDGRVYLVQISEKYIRQLTPAEQTLSAKVLRGLVTSEPSTMRVTAPLLPPRATAMRCAGCGFMVASTSVACSHCGRRV